MTTTTRTHRTALIEHSVSIPGRTFCDVGAADGYESRAVARSGAARALAVEGKPLKRLRPLTGQWLLLETHVAPQSLRGLLPKHTRVLPFAMHEAELDGARFDGKFVPHRKAHAITKGSLDQPWTFWLTEAASLVKALARAGFSIVEYHRDVDAGSSAVVQEAGRALGFGRANTKVWVVAAPSRPIMPADPSTVRPISGNPAWRDHLVNLLRRRYLSSRFNRVSGHAEV